VALHGTSEAVPFPVDGGLIGTGTFTKTALGLKPAWIVRALRGAESASLPRYYMFSVRLKPQPFPQPWL
jgi:hypothetical protein